MVSVFCVLSSSNCRLLSVCVYLRVLCCLYYACMCSSASPLLPCPLADKGLRVFDTRITISPSRVVWSIYMFAVLTVLPTLCLSKLDMYTLHMSKLTDYHNKNPNQCDYNGEASTQPQITPWKLSAYWKTLIQAHGHSYQQKSTLLTQAYKGMSFMLINWN